MESYARKYFSTQKSGVFRRKIPIKELLVYTKEPIKGPLLKHANDDHGRQAMVVFKGWFALLFYLFFFFFFFFLLWYFRVSFGESAFVFLDVLVLLLLLLLRAPLLLRLLLLLPLSSLTVVTYFFLYSSFLT
jgi:hypothetical protein